MSYFDGAYFFLWLAIVLGIGNLCISLKIPKTWVVFASSVFFLYKVLGNEPRILSLLVIFVVWQWGLLQIQLWLNRTGKNTKSAFHWLLVGSLAPIVITRFAELLPLPSLGFLGISYLTFRSAQMIIETWDGLITDVKPLDYLNFMVFFPSISSGPIDRSRRFTEDLHAEMETAERVELASVGAYKLAQGIIYKLIISQLLFTLLTHVQGWEKSWMQPVAYMYVYGLYLFFDFCGYSRMAVGASYMLGIRLPENFDRPFQSENIVDFWNRWHISLSHWFRDFVFTRFTMLAVRNKWFSNRLRTAQVAYLVNMMIMGAWHGLTAPYILYGTYHGVLLGISNIYLKKSAFHKQNRSKKWYRAASIIITFQFVMIGFYIFSGHWVGY